MANELVHASQGTELYQNEFESVTAHILNSQATGDTIYASSATQLSRLAIGATDTLLSVVGGIPAWVSEINNITLDTAVAKGTWTASGTWTIPAVTLGGTITTLSNKIVGGTVGAQVLLKGGTDAAGGGVVVVIDGNAVDSGKFFIYTPNATQTVDTERFSITGSVAISVAAWSSVYHTGMKFGLAGTATGAWTMDGATSGVVTMTVAAVAGTWTMTLPTGVAAAGGYQLADAAGNGVCSWTAAGSRREWKNPLGLEYSVSPSEALDRILGTKVYPFRFKLGFGTGDYETIYQGLYADEAPWAMHFEGGILNPISTFGHTVLAIQALEGQILNLRQEVASLRQSMIGKGSI